LLLGVVAGAWFVDDCCGSARVLAHATRPTAIPATAWRRVCVKAGADGVVLSLMSFLP
jgi:hypothetical protein